MSVFQTLSQPLARPVMCVLAGDAGVGKTTFAAQNFPKPVIIQAEAGLNSLSIMGADAPLAFPLLQTSSELWDQLTGLVTEEHEFKTVIIDSLSALDRLFGQEIIASDPRKPKSLAQAHGGYGAGIDMAYQMHARVRKACGLLLAKGINVCAISHALVETFNPPDADAYDRFTLSLGKKAQNLWTEDSDLVAFLRLETFVKSEDKGSNAPAKKGKAIGSGARELLCHASASSKSKNRYGISEMLQVEMGVNPLLPFIPSLAV